MMVVTKVRSESAQAKLCALSLIKSAYAEAWVADDRVLSDVPWPAVLRLGSAECCLAALCDCALSTEVPQLAQVAPLLTFFRDKERERNAQIASVLDETLARLASRGVEAIALKGGAFLAFGKDCSRAMLDLDLLIRPSDKKKAFEALKCDGYEVPDHDNWYDVLNHHHAPPILNPSGAIAIELHTRLAPNFDTHAISADIIFQHAKTGFIGNSPVSVPSDNHRLTHLIIHSMIADNGYWMHKIRLRDLIDLLEIQKARQVDWQALEAILTQFGYKNRAAAFFVAAELLLFPAFQAPKWAASGRRWAERAVQVFFDPDVAWSQRAVGQFLADMEAVLQNPRRLRISFCRTGLNNSWRLAACPSSSAKKPENTSPFL